MGRCASGDVGAISAVTDDLDLGERAAIALAETMRADLLERLKMTSFYLDDALLNTVFDRWLKP